MHEYSIVMSLLEKVDAEGRRHGATGVERIQVKIGELAGVEIDLLRTAFETFRERTLCAGAELDVTPVPVLWVCPGCEQTIAQGQPLRCGDCALPARLEQGDEIVLERIEMEVA